MPEQVCHAAASCQKLKDALSLYGVNDKSGDMHCLLDDNLSEEQIEDAVSEIGKKLAKSVGAQPNQKVAIILLFAGLFIEWNGPRSLALNPVCESGIKYFCVQEAM